MLEIHITLLVWPCLSLTENQHTVNHMIIFNDSISKFYQCSIQNSPWQLANAETFFSTCLGKKKNSETIRFLGILKKCVSKNKINFCLKKKSNALLNKKVISVFPTIFKLDFVTQIICCIICRSLYSLSIFFCSLISVSKKQNTETMLTLPSSCNWQKFNNKIN